MKLLSTFYWKCAVPLSKRRDLIHWQRFSRREMLRAGNFDTNNLNWHTAICTALELISWMNIVHFTKNRCRKCAIVNTMQFLLLVQFDLRINLFESIIISWFFKEFNIVSFLHSHWNFVVHGKTFQSNFISYLHFPPIDLWISFRRRSKRKNT